ncbi:MAG: hypothetical protein V7744_10540 [Pseudomonadales bacterium]
MTVAKYLERYSEPETDTHALAGKKNRFSHCLVIPCRDESSALLDRLQTRLKLSPKVLIILVINQPESQAERSQNAALANAARSIKHPNILLVDRFSEGLEIPVKQGVGLARKIGCDIACRLIHQGIVTSPWIATSDADTFWPETYFSALDQYNKGSAIIFPFQHSPRPGIQGLPITLYELSLRYYVAGLQFAESPYAYHSIGSTLAIHHAHYAQVRGFPRRSGGEDFHILNKLSKTGPIIQLKEPHVIIADRDSNRAPFGTGPAVSSIGDMDFPLQQYLFYQPECFSLLKHFLQVFPDIYAQKNPSSALDLLDRQLPANLMHSLIIGGLEKTLHHAFAHAKDKNTFERHMHNGFDALATLRLIHSMRDNGLKSVGFDDLIHQAKFQHLLQTPESTEINRLIAQLELLADNIRILC